jgi:PncC family amidohydrolase
MSEKKLADVSLALHEHLLSSGKTLAFAESCTGGFLSHLMTQHSGASNYFLGSLVTYSNSLKEKVLSVSKETLEIYGAVSEETVKEMLNGALSLTGANVGIAVSGIAGPLGGTLDKPVGTIWYALGSKEETEVGCLHLEGSRKEIIFLASNLLLEVLYRKLKNGKNL